MNSRNSVKGPKDPNSAKKCQKVTSSSKMCQKITPKRAKSRHNSLLRQNSVKFGSNFTQVRKHFTRTLFARSYVFASLILCYINLITTHYIHIIDYYIHLNIKYDLILLINNYYIQLTTTYKLQSKIYYYIHLTTV